MAGKRTHELKIHPAPFRALLAGEKRHEFRRNDRGFQVGDALRLSEFDPERKCYTGKFVDVSVTYLAEGPEFGIPDGFCVMSIARVTFDQAVHFIRQVFRAVGYQTTVFGHVDVDSKHGTAPLWQVVDALQLALTDVAAGKPLPELRAPEPKKPKRARAKP